jgi:hypothetical protein
MSDKPLFPGFLPRGPSGPQGGSVSHWGASPFEDDYARWRADYERDLRSRRPRGRRPLAGLVALLLAVFAASFIAAPLFAFRAVRAAAQFGDVEALSRSVDFDAVRQSLRVQLRPRSAEAQAPASMLADPLAALRRVWEPMTPQADVNAYLTAESLAALTAGRGPDGAAAPPAGAGGDPFPRVRYWDLERARLGVSDPEVPERETLFTFERRGLFRWTLVGVRLPAPPPAPAAF